MPILAETGVFPDISRIPALFVPFCDPIRMLSVSGDTLLVTDFTDDSSSAID